MALRLTITAEEAEQGFDELLVLGLCDGDATDGDDRLTAMLTPTTTPARACRCCRSARRPTTPRTSRPATPAPTTPTRRSTIERGPSLAGSTSGDSDGSRLATALGIDAEVLAHVAGADGTDATDALLDNRRSYPGTIGHALEELAPGLISRDARDRLRAYALGNVSARGLQPAIRVDDQPYGLLPAVALSRFQTDLRDSGLDTATPDQQARQQKFEDTLLELFRQLHQDWSAIATAPTADRPSSTRTAPRSGRRASTPSSISSGCSGLEPSSVGSSYRFSLNVADRGGVRGEPDLGLGFGMPPADGTSVNTAAELGPFALMEHLDDGSPHRLRVATCLDATQSFDGAGVGGLGTGASDARDLAGLRAAAAHGALALAGRGRGPGGRRYARHRSLDPQPARSGADRLTGPDRGGPAECRAWPSCWPGTRCWQKHGARPPTSWWRGGCCRRTALATLGTSSLYQTWSQRHPVPDVGLGAALRPRQPARRVEQCRRPGARRPRQPPHGRGGQPRTGRR